MNNGKTATISFTDSEMLTLMDWFNGYTSKYYGTNPEVISQKLPDNHKELIDKILSKYDEVFSEYLSDDILRIMRGNG